MPTSVDDPSPPSQPPLQALSPRKIYGRSSADATTALVKVTMAADADVADLAKALIAELQLGVPPDRVVLTVVDEDGTIIKVLNDPKATLDMSGVASGATVVVAVQPPVASYEAGASSPNVCTRGGVAPVNMCGPRWLRSAPLLLRTDRRLALPLAAARCDCTRSTPHHPQALRRT